MEILTQTMVKIGLIVCGYKCANVIDEILDPWVKLKEELNITIAVVNGMFKEYEQMGYKDDDRETQIKLDQLKTAQKIDYLYIQNPLCKSGGLYEQEHQIRNRALQWLKVENCDLYFLLDLSDEFYTTTEILNIFNFIKKNPNYGSYFLQFKNYFGDGTQWLDGFCPVRVFRKRWAGFTIDKFYYDNDISYSNGQITISYQDFASCVIPREVAHIKHNSWTNDKARDKIAYQKVHFGGECSFLWSESENTVKINEDYYIRNNKKLPIIYKD